MPAKLMHLIGQLDRGGAEKQLFCVATGLLRRGWGQVVVAFDTGGLWEARLKDAGVPVFFVPRDRLKLRRLWRLWWLVRRERPQVVLSWTAHLGIYARLLRGIGRVRRVYHLLDDVTLDCDRPEKRRLSRQVWGAMEAADCVVSNSRRNLDLAQRHGLRLPPNFVIYNPVAAPGRARPAEPAACPRIVAAGTLHAGKAYDVLLAALGRLAAEGLSFECLLAGSGPERPALEALAARLGLSQRVQFLGDIDDVPALFSTAHILAHPSKSEGLSNTILEAMGEGLPVVACPVGATAEILADGESGLLVMAGAVEELAAALRRLLTDPELRGRLGKAARESALRFCGENTVSDQWEALLHRLVKEGNRCRSSY
jgi:glycosyltransferase involved in cell wall biosynthesis